MAFAPYEARPLLGAVKLFRGVAIQLAYRWATGQVVAGPSRKAVLMWSIQYRGEAPRPLRRELFAVTVAASVGVAMVLACNGLLLVPFGIALMTAGAATHDVIVIGLTIVAVSLTATSWQALLEYQNEQALAARLPLPSVLRWRIDCLAAIPARNGHGGHLLDGFLFDADASDAEVVLHCSRRNVAFYRRHGFHVVADDCPDGQRLMLRKARSSRLTLRHERDHIREATGDAGNRSMPPPK